MPEMSPPEDLEPQPSVEDGPTSLRDRWWWSPALSIVLGLAVAGYQWGPLTGSGGFWGNWLIAAIGVGVAVSGVLRLVRAYPR